ncbi:ras association domain-containing protein 5-like isoform X2 [Halichondria panicea]|uniref:ras association domain-containing protein 5-like isoform X2 n=1 Tax=Halichondria panicea TaxID=6063 RepID=UPI00312B70FF
MVRFYRHSLARCEFIVHRKCETKVTVTCSSRLHVVLSHDKQESTPPLQVVVLRNHSSQHSTSDNTHTESGSSNTSNNSSSTSSSQVSSHQLIIEKTKLTRKIQEYNRKTTPVHHIHLRSSHNDPSLIEYQGFVRVHMCVQRPIHVSTAITRTSWYRLMRPVKERTTNSVDGMSDGFETAFYLPTDTNRLVHIINTTTTKELVSILLKKFCVTDNPKKFSLYEEYGSDCRRLFEEDHPLEIMLDGSCAHRNSKLVLRDNTYSTIQWDAFALPELTNFIRILHQEEEIYIKKLTARFAAWKQCICHAQKEACMEDITKQTRQNI